MRKNAALRVLKRDVCPHPQFIWYMPLQMEKDLQIFWKILIGKAALQGVVGGETGMQEMEIKSRGKWWRLGEMGASQDSDASSCCFASQSNSSPQPALVYAARSFNYCQICLATSQNVFDVRLGDTMSRLLHREPSFSSSTWPLLLHLIGVAVCIQVVNIPLQYCILWTCCLMPPQYSVYQLPRLYSVYRSYYATAMLYIYYKTCAGRYILYIFVPLQLPVCSNGLCTPRYTNGLHHFRSSYYDH